MKLSFWANLGSLVGLAATLWTAWSAYRSKRYYLLVGRVPEQINDLQSSTSALIEHNHPDADRKDRLRALKGVHVSLESIARNIGWRHSSHFADFLARNTSWIPRSKFRELKSRIETIEQEKSLDPEIVEDIWFEAEGLAKKAQDIVKDSKFVRGS